MEKNCDGKINGTIHITAGNALFQYEEEDEELNEFLEENGSWALEDEGEWYLDETECWVWGPIEITNEDDDTQRRIIIADDEGNVTEFKDDA